MDLVSQLRNILPGEHSIGFGKAEHLKKEHGDLLSFMREIKRLVEPIGVLIPGKLFPTRAPFGRVILHVARKVLVRRS